MNFAAEHIQIASLISKRVQELAAAGLDDVTLFGEMADYMPGFKRLMDTCTRNEMDGLCESFPPRWSPQKRPYVVTSKPAIAIGRRRDCFTLSRCIWASRDCCGLGRHLCSDVGGSEEWGHFGRIVAVLPLAACNHFRHLPAQRAGRFAFWLV
jgi:hypothetical protein